MSRIDDARSLADLRIPGTHDSGALHEPLAGLAKTQALTITEQLDAGVRFLDLRARIIDDGFWLYHGSLDQDQPFEDVFGAMYALLDANPSETIIASLKEEAPPDGATKSFDAVFADYVARSPEHWDLRDTIPTLGEVRGKIILVRRFDAVTPVGIDAAPWADNATFSIANASKLRVQDEYIVTNNEAKWTAITTLLDEPRDGTTLFLDYASGYRPTDMGLSDILAVSTDIDARLEDRLRSPVAAGVIVMDYVDEQLVTDLIATNR
jgi:1-phosphatidylinositol phosphodiesterase